MAEEKGEKGNGRGELTPHTEHALTTPTPQQLCATIWSTIQVNHAALLMHHADLLGDIDLLAAAYMGNMITRASLATVKIGRTGMVSDAVRRRRAEQIERRIAALQSGDIGSGLSDDARQEIIARLDEILKELRGRKGK